MKYKKKIYSKLMTNTQIPINANCITDIIIKQSTGNPRVHISTVFGHSKSIIKKVSLSGGDAFSICIENHPILYFTIEGGSIDVIVYNPKVLDTFEKTQKKKIKRAKKASKILDEAIETIIAFRNSIPPKYEDLQTTNDFQLELNRELENEKIRRKYEAEVEKNKALEELNKHIQKKLDLLKGLQCHLDTPFRDFLERINKIQQENDSLRKDNEIYQNELEKLKKL
jgi:hypothetical protein